MQMQSPFGIKILNSILANSFNSSVIELVVPESDTTDLFMNDPVISLHDTDDDGIEYCRKALPGESIRGLVVGFQVDHIYENRIYRKGGIRRKVRICEDPFIYCKAQVDDILLDTDIGSTMNIDGGAGNTTTGTSEIQLDYSTIAADGRQFRVQKILKRVDTSSDPFFPEKYTLVEGIISNHELLAGTGVVSTGLWDRISASLVPHVSTDSVNVGGGLVDTNVTIPVLVGDISNTTFDTINQTIIGAVNELFATTTSNNAVEDILPVTINGQTSFTLSSTPVSDAAFALYLNGQLRRLNVDYTRVGTLITWLDPAGLTLVTTDELIARYNDSGAFVATTPIAREEDLTVTINGQTAFTITYTPVSDAAFALYLNGQLRERGTDYTQSGTNVTWLDPGGLTLITTDKLIARYNSVGTGNTRELFIAGTDYNSNFGNFRTRSIAGTGVQRFTFHAPDDFGTLIKLRLIGIPSAGAAGINRDIDLTSDYGGLGQAYNFYSETDTTTLYDLSGTSGEITEVVDLSIVFSNLAAGQHCGVLVDHNAIGGAVDYLGIEFSYILAP
jgi:hypothetical protein